MMRIVRPVLATVGGVGQRVADLARLQEVAGVLVRHGLGLLVSGLGVPGIPRTRAIETTPERAVRALQELGPTFVKLGQVLSTRNDLLPDAYCAAFETLQDEVKPLPLAEVEASLTEALGPHWRDAVTWFEDKPLATASIAQVHRADLTSGEAVVFKVQRRGIAPKIRADLSILKRMASAWLQEFPETAAFDPRGILDEFERSITSELDFLREAENTKRFADNFADDPRCRVPRVYDALTTETVLCLEYLEGVPIRRARSAGFDMERVGERYLSVAYDMLFVHGLFHGDLHPGNVLVMEGEVLGILDFGMIGRMTREMRAQVLVILIAAQRRDHRTLARVFWDIAIKEKRVDWAAVERDTLDILERNLTAENMADIEISRFLRDLTAAANRHGARVPLTYTMFFKALLTSEGLARSLLQEQNPIAAATPYFERMIAEAMSREALQQEALYQAIALGPLAKRLPVALSQLLDDFDAERLQIRIREVPDPARLLREDRRTNRAILAAFTLGAFASGTAALFATPYHAWGIPLLSIGFWGLGATLGGWVLLGIVRSGGDH
jgi:ubiquinone biosynthesis protein